MCFRILTRSCYMPVKGRIGQILTYRQSAWRSPRGTAHAAPERSRPQERANTPAPPTHAPSNGLQCRTCSSHSLALGTQQCCKDQKEKHTDREATQKAAAVMDVTEAGWYNVDYAATIHGICRDSKSSSYHVRRDAANTASEKGTSRKGGT